MSLRSLLGVDFPQNGRHAGTSLQSPFEGIRAAAAQVTGAVQL